MVYFYCVENGALLVDAEGKVRREKPVGRLRWSKYDEDVKAYTVLSVSGQRGRLEKEELKRLLALVKQSRHS